MGKESVLYRYEFNLGSDGKESEVVFGTRHERRVEESSEFVRVYDGDDEVLLISGYWSWKREPACAATNEESCTDGMAGGRRPWGSVFGNAESDPLFLDYDDLVTPRRKHVGKIVGLPNSDGRVLVSWPRPTGDGVDVRYEDGYELELVSQKTT